MSENPSPDLIMQVGFGFWPSKILLSAVEMELFSDLAKGPQTLASVDGRMGLHPRASRDFLDWLVALGCEPVGNTPTRPQRIFISIRTSRRTSALFSKWRTIGSTASGVT